MAHDRVEIPLGVHPELGSEVSPELYNQIQEILLALKQLQDKVNELVEAVNALENP